ncbi:hypothetical protein, partial [Alloprevotella tannerae]
LRHIHCNMEQMLNWQKHTSFRPLYAFKTMDCMALRTKTLTNNRKRYFSISFNSFLHTGMQLNKLLYSFI